MRNALLVVSGVAIGLLGALVAVASNRIDPFARAHAQTVQGDAAAGAPILGIGGATPNQNDLCWLLLKDKGRDKAGQEHERYALCLYKAMNGGQFFDLIDMRDVTYDSKPAQLNNPGHKADLKVQAMKDMWEDARKKEEEARKKREEEEKKKKSGN